MTFYYAKEQGEFSLMARVEGDIEVVRACYDAIKALGYHMISQRP